MKQLAGERARRLQVSQEIFSIQRRRETEECVYDDIGERCPADALLHAAVAFGNAHRRVKL